MNINQIKEQYTCQDYLGKPLKRTAAGWYVYRCPWRNDRHPSLNVSPDGKVWHDLATGAKGGIIELVIECLGTRDFARVCAAFDSSSFSQPKVFSPQKEKEIKRTAYSTFEVVPLRSRGLFAYLAERKVDIDIARQFLHEAHYSFQQRQDGRYLTALAYANDKGGYELRGTPYKANENGFKGGTAPKWITSHHYKENTPTVVFEGFIDMLSFATLCGGVKHNYIVLNSIVNAPAAIEVLRPISGKVYLCLDNDPRGDDTTKQMLDALPGAVDIRSRFAGYKDVNDFLLKKKI